jgi:hypothetical protein
VPSDEASGVGPADADREMRRRARLRLVMIALAAKHAEDERRRRDLLLERRIAEVRRMFDADLGDGHEIEAMFGQACEVMAPEERERFLRDYLASCRAVLRAAGGRMRDAFIESLRHEASRTERGGR